MYVLLQNNVLHQFVATKKRPMLWPRIEDPVEKSKFRASFLDKLRYLDEKTKAGNTLAEKIQFLSPQDWEAISTVEWHGLRCAAPRQFTPGPA